MVAERSKHVVLLAWHVSCINAPFVLLTSLLNITTLISSGTTFVHHLIRSFREKAENTSDPDILLQAVTQTSPKSTLN